MKLPFSFSLPKKEEPEYFLALLLRDEKATAVIFEEINGKIKEIGESEEYFSESVENSSDEEWLNVLDKIISKAEGALPENVQTQKTIFGLKENWILENHIKKEYLERIKKISKTLDLTPIGFIVISEAIAHLLEKKEGVPVSAILTQIDKKNITISLIRAGKIARTQTAPIQDSIVKTADDLLHYFTDYAILPSRIILLNSEDSDYLNQQFISHTWSKSLPFMHVPQVSILPKGFDAQAVLSGTATQMGFEMLGQDLPSKKSKDDESLKEDKESIDEAKEDIETLGFLKEEDIAHIHLKKTNIPESLEEETEEKELATFSEPSKTQVSKNRSAIQKNILAFLNTAVLSSKKIIPKIRIPSLPMPKKKGLFIVPLILAVFIAIFVLYIFMAKAKVTISIKPNVMQQTQAVTLSSDSNTDFSKNIIHVDKISVSETGSASTNSTGTKEIGNKAKGTVTIRNISTNAITLSSGTVITSSNGLNYTLDNSINIASNSAFQTTPPTQDVSVTASDIGSNYNLPSGTQFTIGSNSSIGAVNNDPFSGGSKKEITVVSMNDYEKLLAEIPKNMESKAKNDIAQKVSQDMGIIPTLTNETITGKHFSKNVGDQVSSVTLTATVSYQSLSYNKTDLKNFSLNLFKQRIQNETVGTNGISFSLTNIKENKDKTVTADINAKASLIPQIDTKNLITQIQGKSFQNAEAAILKLPQVQNVSITLSPPLPILPRVLPRIGKNIDIIIYPSAFKMK